MEYKDYYYIVHDGKEIKLTYEDEQFVRKQQLHSDAVNLIDNLCDHPDEIITALGDESLIELAESIDEAANNNEGEVEWNLLMHFKCGNTTIGEFDSNLLKSEK